MTTLTTFQKEIFNATKSCFKSLMATHSEENFYAYALYTDESAMTIMPSANSVEGLAEVLETRCTTKNSDIANFKWSTAEWKYEAWESTKFKEISRKLRSDEDRVNFIHFVNKIHNDMVVVLKELDSEGFFGIGKDRDKVTLFISISDSDDSFEIENNSAKILNPLNVYELFINRYD